MNLNLTQLEILVQSVTSHENRINRLNNLVGQTNLPNLSNVTLIKFDRQIRSSSTVENLHENDSSSLKMLKIKTKKCQPAASDTPDLIQTECVADRGLARQKNKNKQNIKNKNKNHRNLNNVTLPKNYRHTSSSSTERNHKENYLITLKVSTTKTCQPAASDTPDLIQTECVADSRLACHKNKNKPYVKNKIKNKINLHNVTLVKKEKHNNKSHYTSRKCRNKLIKQNNRN